MRRDGAANRERILLAAEHVFGEGGTAASTEEVARRAQVGVATVFRHFPTKQDLLEATALRYLEKMKSAAQPTDEVDPGKALASVMQALVATGPTKVTLLGLLLSDGPGLTEPITAAVQAVRDAVRLVLERAQAAGAARPDTTVDEVFTLARALAHVATPDEREAVDRAMGVVLDGLGVHR